MNLWNSDPSISFSSFFEVAVKTIIGMVENRSASCEICTESFSCSTLPLGAPPVHGAGRVDASIVQAILCLQVQVLSVPLPDQLAVSVA